MKSLSTAWKALPPQDKATYAEEARSKRSSTTSGLTNDQFILRQLKSINNSASSDVAVGVIWTMDIGLGISVVKLLIRVAGVLHSIPSPLLFECDLISLFSTKI